MSNDDNAFLGNGFRQMLNKSKVNMKRDLENSITNYNDSVLAVHQVWRRMLRAMAVRLRSPTSRT